MKNRTLPLEFEKLTSPEIGRLARRRALVLLPFGQVEEHGPHLPVETDARIATELGHRIASAASRRIPIVLAPTLWTGYSGKEMARWPGMIRVRTRVVMDLLFDVVSSFIEMSFRRVVLLSTHGHHSELARVVMRELHDAWPQAHLAVIDPVSLSAETYRAIRRSAPGGSCHAGEWETSLMLFFGARVEMSKASNLDHLRYSSEFVPPDTFSGPKPVFWSTWKIQRSRTGVYGDPTVADAETGRQLVESVVERASRFLEEFYRFRSRGECEELHSR